MNKIQALTKKFISITDYSRNHISAIIDLGLRVWIALIFWKSGVMKTQNWDVTLMLFEDEHPVPFLSADVAAYLGTANELLMPFLLVIGLGGRFAAVALVFMTAVIHFTYMNSHDHFIWFLVLLAILVRGAGMYSLDFFLRGKYMGNIIKTHQFSRYIAAIIVAGLIAIAGHEALAVAVDSIDPWLENLIIGWNKLGSV